MAEGAEEVVVKKLVAAKKSYHLRNEFLLLCFSVVGSF